MCEECHACGRLTKGNDRGISLVAVECDNSIYLRAPPSGTCGVPRGPARLTPARSRSRPSGWPAASSTTAVVPSSAISRESRLSSTATWACRWPGCAAARPLWSSRSFRPAGANAGSSAVRRQTALWSCAGQPRTPCPSPLRALAKLRAAAGALPAAGATAAAAAGRRS